MCIVPPETHHCTVVHVMKVIVRSVLVYALVGTKLFIWHNTFHMC